MVMYGSRICSTCVRFGSSLGLSIRWVVPSVSWIS